MDFKALPIPFPERATAPERAAIAGLDSYVRSQLATLSRAEAITMFQAIRGWTADSLSALGVPLETSTGAGGGGKASSA